MAAHAMDTAGVDENLLARLDRAPLTRTISLVVILLTLAWLVESFDIGIVGTIVLLLKKLWHLSPSQLGLLGSSSTIGIVLGLIPAGRLADRYGRRTCLVWGIAVFSIFTLLTALAGSVWSVALLRFVAGLGEGAVFPVPYLMISEFVNAQKRGQAVGWAELVLTSGYTLPSLVGIWAVSSFAPTIAWRIPLLIGGLPLLIIVPLLLWVPESPRFLLKRNRQDDVRAFVEKVEREARLPHDISLTNPRALEVLKATEERNVGPWTLLRRPYLERSLIAYSALAASFVLWYTMLTYAPTIFRIMGAQASNALLYTAIMMFIAGFGALLQGALGDRYGRKRIHTAYIVISAIGLFFLARGAGVPVTATAGFLAAFFGLGSFTLSKIYLAEQYPTRLRGVGSATGELVTRFLCGAVLVYYIPALLEVLQPARFFGLAGAVMVALVLPMLFFGQETANRSVEETGTDLRNLRVESAAADGIGLRADVEA